MLPRNAFRRKHTLHSQQIELKMIANAYTITEISEIIKAKHARIVSPDSSITTLLTDSRTLTTADGTLFFAIPTKRNTGCRYIGGLYAQGVRNFVIPNVLSDDMEMEISACAEANFLRVENVVGAMQSLVAYHRNRFDIPIVGVTGSNGKTIVKDWILQLLSSEKKMVGTPRSYNSQIGVPLSVWQLTQDCEMAVFEAGVSLPCEMWNLQEIIRPSIGIFTNIGQAHDENFITRGQKITEKLQLFTHSDVIIYCDDHKDISSIIIGSEVYQKIRHFTWGKTSEATVQLLSSTVQDGETLLSVKYREDRFETTIPFTDKASIENAMHCITLLLYLGYAPDFIMEKTPHLLPVAMRLEVKEGINNCQLVNDGYSLDINSLVIALDFIQQEKQHAKKTLIMSDIMQSGMIEPELYDDVARLVSQRGITRFIGIGEALKRNAAKFPPDSVFFNTTDEFLQKYAFSQLQNETILLKGARMFHFERIAKLLQRKSHETIMEVNLGALVRNLNYYRSRISPTTKLMAMVKAFSYGAGNVEIANTLQFNHVDYLTVAYTDEGQELRQNGITLPIMIMNPEEDSFDNIIRLNLEPDIYSFRILDLFAESAMLCCSSPFPIHIELDTGMHRLGFMENEVERLGKRLLELGGVVSVKSIFSHLACSEDPAMDDFTRGQISKFKAWSSKLKKILGDDSIACHILNSSGITRFPEADMDMVRLGIGLYGISPEPEVQKHLQPVSRLKTQISQIKDIPQGDSVGYNCRWIAKRPSRIAIIPIGYADGLNRRLGNEIGKVIIKDRIAPIVGSICMDMCFVDVTGIDCSETDEVTIFGNAELLHEIADAMGTIPYEILTSVSHRVKRIYYRE